jgi:hypothetical protein
MRQHGLEMPFTDLDSLKVAALDTVKDELRSLQLREIREHGICVSVVGLVVAWACF